MPVGHILGSGSLLRHYILVLVSETGYRDSSTRFFTSTFDHETYQPRPVIKILV